MYSYFVSDENKILLDVEKKKKKKGKRKRLEKVILHCIYPDNFLAIYTKM